MALHLPTSRLLNPVHFYLPIKTDALHFQNESELSPLHVKSDTQTKHKYSAQTQFLKMKLALSKVLLLVINKEKVLTYQLKIIELKDQILLLMKNQMLRKDIYSQFQDLNLENKEML